VVDINLRRFCSLLFSLAVLINFYAWLVSDAYSKNLLPMQLKELHASDSAAHDNYGIIVALSADTAVIGIPFDDSPGFNAGSAYVYTRSHGAWTVQQKLVASDSAPGDQFGWSLALQGDTLFIGARFDDDRGFNSGSVYVYTRNSDVWTEQQKLTANDGSVNDQYGHSIALAGNRAIIGAPLDDNRFSSGSGFAPDFDSRFDTGSAYVYRRNVNAWTLEQKLIASDGAPGDQFGWSVALQGDSALIGARFDDDKAFNSGSAYLFNVNLHADAHADKQAWRLKQKLTAAEGATNDQFGWSVALDSGTAVIGARFDDDKGVNSGSATIYTRNAETWIKQQHLTASNGKPGNQYSWALALHNNTLIIGAPFDNVDGPLSGSSYVYTHNAGLWQEKQILSSSIEVLGERYGISVALQGNDILVGACLDYEIGSSSGSPHANTNTTCVPFVHVTTVHSATNLEKSNLPSLKTE